MSIIIAVTGRKQSGKDTLCRFLSNRLYGRCNNKIYSFADPLKRFCIDVMGLRESQCYGSDEEKNTETPYLWDNVQSEIRYKYGKDEITSHLMPKEFGGMERIVSTKKIQRSGNMTSRECLQIVGTDVMRKMFSDMIWVNATLRMIEKDKYPIAFIADMRFKSEANALLDNPNAYVIRLTRKIYEDAHESEKDLDDYDFKKNFGDRCLIVDNQNMTIEQQHAAVVPFFDCIIGKKYLED